MKTLPCYVILASFTSIALLATSVSLGVALPYLDIAAHIIGYACAVGLLAFGCTDRPYRSSRYAAHLREMQAADELAAVRWNGAAGEPEWDHSAPDTDRVLRTLGVGHDPATVSMM